MAEVRLAIAGREYIVTCRNGEEARLAQLGQMVDAKVLEAGGNTGGLNESRQLLFAALLLADQLHDGLAQSDTRDVIGGISPETTARMALSIEKLADRIESFAAGLEEAGRSA